MAGTYFESLRQRFDQVPHEDVDSALSAFAEVIDSMGVEDRLQDVMGVLGLLGDTWSETMALIEAAIPFAHFQDRSDAAKMRRARVMVSRRLQDLEVQQRESILLRDHASIWLAKQTDLLLVAMEHRFYWIPVDQRLAVTRALEHMMTPVIGTRSAQLYDLATVLRDSSRSLVRSVGLSWDAWLMHLEAEMLVRDLSLLSSGEGLIESTPKQASIARFLRALSGLPIKVRLQDMSDLSEHDWAIVSQLTVDARAALEEISVQVGQSVADIFLPIRADVWLRDARNPQALQQACERVRMMLSSPDERETVMFRATMFETLGLGRPEVAELRELYAAELATFLGVGLPDSEWTSRLEDWEQLDTFLAARVLGEPGVLWSARRAGSTRGFNGTNLRIALENITVVAAEATEAPRIPTNSFANLQVIASMQRVQLSPVARELVLQTIETVSPTLSEAQRLRIAETLIKGEPHLIRIAVGLARIADIRLLSLDRPLAMVALSVSEQRLDTIRVIVSNLLNIHVDLLSDGGSLVNYLVALPDEELVRTASAVQLLTIACKDYEVSSVSGVESHPVFGLVSGGSFGAFFSAINAYLPMTSLHRVKSRLGRMLHHDELQAALRSPMEVIGPVVAISEAIFNSPWFGKAFEGSTGTVKELMKLSQTVFEAYYGPPDLVHHIDFPEIKSAVEEYLTEIHRVLPHLVDSMVHHQVLSRTLTMFIRGLLVRGERSLAQTLREASALLRSAA